MKLLTTFLPGELRLERGTAGDYRALEAHHYRRGRPASWAQIWTIRYVPPPGRSRHGPRVAAVAVVSYPIPSCLPRRRALGLVCSPAEELAFANEHIRTISRVKAANLPFDVIAKSDNMPIRYRPKSEWTEKAEPRLEKFLDPKVRRIAAAEINRYLDQPIPSVPISFVPPRRPKSPYILSGIIHSRQGGYSLVGSMSGWGGQRRRYYCVADGHSEHRVPKGHALRRLIPAAKIEKVVLGAVAEVLSKSQWVKVSLQEFLSSRKAKTTRGRGLTNLRNERKRLSAQLDAIAECAGPRSTDLLRPKMQRIEARLATLDQEVALFEAAEADQNAPAVKSIDAILTDLRRLADRIDSLNVEALRNLMRHMVHKLEIDLESREFELSLMLPDRVATGNSPASDMCTETKFAYRFSPQTHITNPLIVATFVGHQKNICHEFEIRMTSTIKPDWTGGKNRAAA
jgi:hypothetical protein